MTCIQEDEQIGRVDGERAVSMERSYLILLSRAVSMQGHTAAYTCVFYQWGVNSNLIKELFKQRKQNNSNTQGHEMGAEWVRCRIS